jgi:hypothetical protein
MVMKWQLLSLQMSSWHLPGQPFRELLLPTILHFRSNISDGSLCDEISLMAATSFCVEMTLTGWIIWTAARFGKTKAGL